MEKASKIKDRKTRFDARISETQKMLFEKAAGLGGYRTLTDFLISSAQEKANAIIEHHQAILTSLDDQATFFDAIINPPKPNENLKSAFKRYQQSTDGQ
jgi:uncharacterized protein (DUF1778 family)